MTKKDFQQRKASIRSLYEEGHADVGEGEALDLVEELDAEKNYSFIVELYHSPFVNPKEGLWTFEVAFALNEAKHYSEAEQIYEYLADQEPENSSILNNLSNIKKESGKIDQAFELIQRAYQISPKDEIVSRNYENLLAIVRERDERDQFYRHALTHLPRENEFVIQKLQSFFAAAKKDQGFRNNLIPIPRWKFRVMMGTDEQKALSLLDQWIEKGYLRKTGQRGNYQEHVYELNPFLFAELPHLKPKKLNQRWIQGLEQLNLDTLDGLSYFSTMQRAERVKKSIRTILLRDLDELFINYIMKNDKAIIILSGSIVEILLIYFCEKRHIHDITYQRHNKMIGKKLYECDLGDLLAFFEENKLLGDAVVHMGNISRIYRNFVHPGKELREQVVLDQAKANLCFVSTLEILNRVCT
jgi:tetratricopeptide (TPR) repeat protein